MGTTIQGDVVVGDKISGDKVIGDKVMGDKFTGHKIIHSAAPPSAWPATPPGTSPQKPGPWRVFLSHTSELRQFPTGGSYISQAERAVSAAGHAIGDMADFAASDQPPASVCIQKVRNSDVYVGIYGLRYGSPVRDQPEISYTELEFNTATAMGMPRLVFMVDANSEQLGLPPNALIDPTTGTRQAAFLQRVKDSGLTVQFFRNPDDLKALVERSLRELGERRNIVVANAEEARVVLSSLRWSWPKPWDFSTYRAEKREGFVGREWLFQEVRKWATDPQSEQALLIGADYGVGKSAFLAQLIETGAAGIPLVAEHFCTTEQAATLTAELFVRNLAAQLAEALPAYRKRLEADDAAELRRWLDEASKDPARAFDQAVLAPLAALDPAPEPQLLVVDALDEAQDPVATPAPGASLTIVGLLARYAKRLPPWLKLLATSRRRPDVLKPLRQSFTLKEIDAEEARNLADLRTYAVARCLQSPLREILLKANLTPVEVGEFLSSEPQSSGKFLYVERVLKDLQTKILPLRSHADLEALPPGLDGFYAEAFCRRFPTEEDYGLVRRILAVLAEAKEPVGREELAAILNCEEQEISDRLRPLRDLLRLRPMTIERDKISSEDILYSFDHLSLQQWLTEIDVEELMPRAGRFAVDRQAGAELIRTWALAEVSAGRAHTRPYLVRHLDSHLSVDERAEVIGGQLVQFPWLQARLKLAGLNALLGDFDPNRYSPSILPPELKALERALRQAAHVLNHNDGWSGQEQLASQLLARLPDGAAPQSLGQQTREWLHRAGGMPPRFASLVYQDALLRTLPVGSDVQVMAALPNGLLACSYSDGIIRLWDPASGECTGDLMGHQGSICAMVVLGDGRLASGSVDATIRLWDLETRQCTAILQDHSHAVASLAVLADGRLASGASDGSIHLWDPMCGTCCMSFHSNEYQGSALSALDDGRIAWINEFTDHINLLDSQDGACESINFGIDIFCIEDCCVSRNGALYFAGRSGVTAWDPLKNTWTRIDEGVGFWKSSICELRDGRIAVGTYAGEIYVYDPRSNYWSDRLPSFSGVVVSIVALCGERIAAHYSGGQVRIWDASASALSDVGVIFQKEVEEILALAALPDGRVATNNFNLWSSVDGSCTGKIPGHGGTTKALLVLPTGQIASCAWHVYISNLGNQTAWQLDDPPKEAGRFLSLGLLSDWRLASGSDRALITIWDISSRSVSSVLEGHAGAVNALAALPDGRLASGSSDGTVRLWEPNSGKWIRAFYGHKGGVGCLVVLHDGRLASGCSSKMPGDKYERKHGSPVDSTIRLWDPESGSCSAVFEGHQGWVYALAVLGDGRLASASADSTIRLWDPARPDGAPRVLFVADAAITALVWLPTQRLLVAGDGSGRLHWLEMGHGQTPSIGSRHQ